MSQQQEKPLFGQALETKERIEVAKEEVRRARQVLTNANFVYERASADLVHILQEASAENTAELQLEAESEHSRLLREELRAAMVSDDFKQVEILARKIAALKEKIGPLEEQRGLKEDDELSRALEEFLADNNIKEEADRRHYRERAKVLIVRDASATVEDIIDALKRERGAAKPPKISPGWIGHR